MGPQLLIVADPDRGRDAAEQVRALGYEADTCSPRELNRRVRMADPPDAVLLSADDADPSLLLAGLRRSRRGASIPVLVFGSMGGDINDLADVLDLGGDGFVPEPIEEGVLAQALDELVGPPEDAPAPDAPRAREHRASSSPRRASPPPSFDPPPTPEADPEELPRYESRPRESSASASGWRRETTDVLDDRGRPRERDFLGENREGRGEGNAVLGQLHATLDRLEARLRDDGETAEPDEELDSFGFDDIPDVQPEGEPLDPDDSNRAMRLEDVDAESPRARRARELERRRHSANRGETLTRMPDAEEPRRSRRDERARPPVAEPPVEPGTSGESFTDLSVLREERGERERDRRRSAERDAFGDEGYEREAPRRSRAASRDDYEREPPRRSRAPERDDYERDPPRRSRRAEREDYEREAPRASRRAEGRRRPGPSRAPRRPGRREDSSEHSAALRPRRPERGAGRPAELHAVPEAPVTEHGNLRDKSLAELLWGLHQEAFTGRVTLTRQREQRELWMERGEVVFARSNVGSERLVDSLLRRGVLTRPQYETARRLAAKEPRRAGELLVEAGFIKPRELEGVVQDHLARLVEAAFAWDEGSWETRGGEQIYESVALALSIRRILLDGVRASASVEQIRSWLGARVLRPSLNAKGARRGDLIRRLERELALLPEEINWLEDFTGEFGVPELLRGHRDEVGLLALIYVLNLSGEVELLGVKKAKMASRDPAQIDADRVSERLRLAREADYFELLGIGREAARAEIRRAYHELDATFADEQVEDETRSTMGAQLAELRAALAEARDILVDDAMRSAYLAHLDVALAAEPSES